MEEYCAIIHKDKATIVPDKKIRTLVRTRKTYTILPIEKKVVLSLLIFSQKTLSKMENFNDKKTTNTKIHSVEHNLFIEWMKWLKSNHPEHGFMYDGIISKEDWDEAPKHILFLLKDYNEKGKPNTLNSIDLDNSEDIKSHIFNLRYHLQKPISDPKNWRTWNNVARWTYGLMKLTTETFPSFQEVDNQGDAQHRSANLKQVAVVDVKKKPGGSSCNKAQLKKYFKDFLNHENTIYSFLARQIALYGKMDYIICCGDGVIDVFKKLVMQEPLKEQLTPFASTEHKDYLITKNGTIVINFLHPLLLKKNLKKKSVYVKLMKIAQKALKERFPLP